MKTCTKCGVTKPLSDFSPAKGYSQGVQSQCRKCLSARALERYHERREELAARQREYRRANPEHERARERAYKARVGVKSTPLRSEGYARSRDRILARTAVNRAVRVGKMPRAAEHACVDCHSQARYYDHFKGYAKEHRLDVEPVCVRCSVRRSAIRGEIKVVAPV